MQAAVLTAEQGALRDALWSLLSGCYHLDRYDDPEAGGWSAKVWDAVCGSGAIGVHLPEDVGGQGGSVAELCVVAEVFGRALYDGPYLTSQLAGSLAARLAWPDGGETAGRIIRGDLQVALPWRAPGPGGSWQASPAGRLTGEVTGVLNASAADLLLLPHNDDGGRWYAVRAGDYTVASTSNVVDRTRPLSRVLVRDAPAVELAADGSRPGADLASLSSLLISAEQLGVAARCLDDVVAYLKVRHQFGRPIGSFQALRHRVADLLLDVESLRSLVYSAANTNSASAQWPVEVDCARKLASAVAVGAASAAVQLHGGLGFTWEARIHHFLRRAKLNQLIFTGGTETARLLQHLQHLPDAAGPAPADHAELRQQVRQALRDLLPLGWSGFGSLGEGERAEFVRRWRTFLSRHGWLAPGWPAEHGGGGLCEAQQVVLQEEFARAGLPPVADVADVMGIHLLGNTLIEFGADDQRQRFLPRILSGADRWCQGFSEPDAGSDLAGVKTRAELRDGRWVINGQKIWTSGARQADWMFLLARTEPDRPKHRGLSFLLVPMHQDSVETRPIRQISGAEDFCEVFLSGATTDESNIVGQRGDGWDVAMGLLRFERGSTATALAWRLDAEFRQIIQLAKRCQPAPATALRLADIFVLLRSLGALALRMVAGDLPGVSAGVDASLYKLRWSHYWQAATELAVDLCLTDLVTAPVTLDPLTVDAGHLGPADDAYFWWQKYLNARAATIYAGTSQIQREIIATRILGLAR